MSKLKSTGDELQKSVDQLEKTMSTLSSQCASILNPGRNLLFTFLKGIVYGLGILFAVALLVPVAVSILDNIQWVPLIGDFLSQVFQQMNILNVVK
ncbi:MAG: DUF5665 domain-containing protein [bacterium]|nr:DUF5665 domain-containing protein [bacterium]